MRFMRQEEALKAMDLFEGAQEHNRVSKRSLKNWVVNDLSRHNTTPHLVLYPSLRKHETKSRGVQSLSSEYCR
jgi:hypothetical protein